jgi:hypothetical protein
MDALERALGLHAVSNSGGTDSGESLTNRQFLKKYEKVSNYLRYYSRRFSDQEEAFQNMTCWSYYYFLKWTEEGKKTYPTGLAKYPYFAHLNGRVFGSVTERRGGLNCIEGRDAYWAQRKGKMGREPLFYGDNGDGFTERFFRSDEDTAFRMDFDDWLSDLHPPCCKEYFLLRAEGYSVTEIASLRGVCIQTVSKFSNAAVDSFCEHFDIPAERRDYLKSHAAHRRPVKSIDSLPKNVPYSEYIENRRKRYPKRQAASRKSSPSKQRKLANV